MVNTASLAFLLSCAALEASAMSTAEPKAAAGRFVYIAGARAHDEKGRVAGDIKAQTKRVLDSLGATLEAKGSGLENAAAITVYLRNAADFAAMNEVYRDYWSKDPPTRTTVVTGLVEPEALVEMAAVGIPAGGERQVIHPKDWILSPNPYSYGIKSGDTLFLAGLVSRNGKDNSNVPGDMKAQTRVVLDNAGEILRAAGMSHADVVSARVYVTDSALFQDMNEVYRAYFPKDPPARATVKTALTNAQYFVEITMVAVGGPAHEAITTPNADGSRGSLNPNLSSAIRVGERLYLSGMLGNTEANKDDVAGQTRETLARIGRTLKAAGFAWGDVVDGIVYVTDVTSREAVGRLFREPFAKETPPHTLVQTGLMSPVANLEIMLVAKRASAK